MMIYTRTPKSKRKLVPKSVRDQHDKWLADINKMSTNFSRGLKPKKDIKPFELNRTTFVRETEHIRSLCTYDTTPATKSESKKYTGDKMIGIGTLHKSNAVPVFSEKEAKDMASMRR